MTAVSPRETLERPTRDTEVEVLRDRARFWMLMSALLAIALLAIGVWYMVDHYTTIGQSETEGVVADYHEAWAELDGEAVAASFRPGGFIELVSSGQSYARNEIADYVATYPPDSELTLVGDMIVADTGIAAQRFHWSFNTAGLHDIEGISVFRVVDGQIATHWAMFSTVYE